jgi:hypothetical protein
VIEVDPRITYLASAPRSAWPAAEGLDRFITGLGLPPRLCDVGVKRDELQHITTNCMLDDWT